mgnify:CR=1 FL=1
MKFKIFSMLLILGVLSALPLIYTGKLNPVAMMGGDFSMKSAGDETARLKVQAPKNLTNVTTDEKVQMYRWRDEYGVMQYSNTPPAQMQNAERIELDPNHNVIEATKVPEVEVTPTQTSQPEINSPYSVSGMKQAVEDAKAVQDILNQRAEEQKRVLDNL